MNRPQDDPGSNRLGPGLTEDQIKAAIVKSGYPLQTMVGTLLRQWKGSSPHQAFVVQDEWSYVDRDSKDLRTIDLAATLRLHEWDPQPRVRPMLNLLVECKQSSLPFIFFEATKPRALSNFPVVAGLRTDRMKLITDDDRSTWINTILNVLDLSEDDFQRSPTFCHTLSKCVRKGSDLELSGSEAYNGLVLPLIKATQHFVRSEEPVRTAWYFDCHLTVPIAVLDAPMIAVRVEAGNTVLSAVPWVRVLRHEYDEEAEHFERNRLRVIEVLHKDILETYLNHHLIPFARRFAEKVQRHPTELATGEGFAPGLGRDSFRNLEGRLRPRTKHALASRAIETAQRVTKGVRKTRTKVRAKPKSP